MKKIYQVFTLMAFFAFASCGSDDTPTPVEDNQNPTAPSNLLISGNTINSWNISWEAATDNVAITGYNVYLDGIKVQTNVSTASTSVADLTMNSRYNLHVTALDSAGNESAISNTITCTFVGLAEFKNKLSEMGVYTADMGSLTPTEGVQLYEINSTLFTDYAVKQRLIRLPNCSTMKYNNSDLLPTFPDNTLIAKTFYYNLDDSNPSLGQKIIETRIFIKVNDVWLAGNYKWNSTQTEATYTENGSVEEISYLDINGTTQNVDYVIPSNNDCFTCHNNNKKTFPIGMKLRNMNFEPSYVRQNQLAYFNLTGLLEGVTPSSISLLPDWTDASLDILDRGRAYIDINCAHCHSATGAGNTSGLFLDYTREFGTEVGECKPPVAAGDGAGDLSYSIVPGDADASILPFRMDSNELDVRMPEIGRSVIHTEGVALIRDWINAMALVDCDAP